MTQSHRKAQQAGMGKAGKRLAFAVVAGSLAAGGALWASRYQPHVAASQQVDFNRDIRPIFNAHCITCHGGVKQAGGISFSYREQVLGKGKSGRPTVVPGSPRASELMARITSNDPEYRMPLHQQPLSGDEIGRLRRWIEQGAPWQNYWAFVPPRAQALPAVKNTGWVKQPLDRFILALLEAEHLAPAPQAAKTELLRRVSLDLTGLPPTPAEIAAFLADTSSNAYEKQVDRLLASPAYGERWASLWLDLARYGDSKGFEKDHSRPGVWTYRDWVIRALNANMPYDRFVITQMAGDLLPHPSMDDLIATSFHRQTQANDEGGTDDEEFRLAAVMDRASTTWSVLNGVSFNCVQCHSHPYDPIRHVEYYKFMAFFNTSRDADMSFDASLADDFPVLRVPTDRTHNGEALALQQQIATLQNDVVAGSRAVADASHWTPVDIKSGSVSEILAIQRVQDERKAAGKPESEELTQRVAVAIAEKAPRAGFRIHDRLAEKTGTVPINSVFEFSLAAPLQKLTALRLEVPPADPVKARHSPEKGFIVNRGDLWTVAPDGTEQKIALRFMAPDNAENLDADVNRLLRNRKDASAPGTVMTALAAQSGVMANPSLFRTAWVVAVPETPLTLAPGTKLKLQLTQTEAINAESVPPPRIRFSATGDNGWTKLAADPALAGKLARLETAARQLQAMDTVPLPVMAEQAGFERRPTLEFDRGSFLTQIGPDLGAGTPALFPKFPDGPRNRLTLARWFFDPRQPLTARVAVNRTWEQLFGTGLVETLEDFGSAGEMPSHPQLLDWLALHYQNDLHWNMKAVLREMVTSATYRQSAVASAERKASDPRNRLLAHGPAQRLTAEMARDQALLASGLLNPAMFGPPVMPEQPSGIWNEVANNPERWKNATGADRYRRAVYTFIKRTAIYPSLTTFDAAERQLTTPRRIATNTPLQALVTLNDPVFHQAADALAARMQREAHGLDAQLDYGARLVLSRDLSANELGLLRGLHDKAGMAAVASALFNLDAALTR